MPDSIDTMKIEAFILCYNEEKLIRYIMRHYTQFADVTILDTGCTDNTCSIAESMGAKIIHVPCDGMNDFHNRNLKDTCWKDSKADWVIVVDADEFVIPEFDKLNSYANIIITDWYEMYSETFPTTDGNIYDEVTLKHKGRTKINLFRPTIEATNFDTCCHFAFPSGHIVYGHGGQTLHFRHLGLDYILERNRRTQERMSQENKDRGVSIHFAYSKEKVEQEFYEGLNKARYESLR